MINLHNLATLALHPFFNKGKDLAENVCRQLVLTVLTEYLCLTAKTEGNYQCVNIEHIRDQGFCDIEKIAREIIWFLEK